MFREIRDTLKLAVPLAVAQLATFMMGMVDTACVGRYSPEDLAAVAIGNSINFGLVSLGFGIPLALDPLISQAIGAGDHGEAWRWWRRGRLLGPLLALPLAALAIVIAFNLDILGIDAELGHSTAIYTLFRAPGMAFFMLYMVGRAFLQAYENTRAVMVAAVVANIVNLVLDLLLVFGDASLEAIGLPAVGIPALGAMGAGITTLFSTFTLGASMLWMARRHRPSDEAIANAAPVDFRVLVELATPIGLQQAAEVWLFAMSGILAGTFGALAAGGHQVALTLAAGAFMFAIGVASATAVRVGHAIGAGEMRRVRLAGVAGGIVVLGVMTCTATAFLLTPRAFALMLTDQPDVLDLAVPLLAYAAAFAVSDGVQVVAAGALRGAGDVRIPFIITVVGYWGIGCPVALGLAFFTDLGIYGLWIGLTAALTVVAIALSHRFFLITGREIKRVA